MAHNDRIDVPGGYLIEELHDGKHPGYQMFSVGANIPGEDETQYLGYSSSRRDAEYTIQRDHETLPFRIARQNVYVGYHGDRNETHSNIA